MNWTHPAVRIAPLIGLLALSSGCATVTRGTNDALIVNSSPAGADVKLSNGMTGKTPATFKLPRKSDVVVDISKAGYEPATVNVVSQISGAGGAGMAGNVLIGGLIGAAVDAGSGAMNDLEPNPVSVTLEKIDTSAVIDQKISELQRLRRSRTISEHEYRMKRAEILREL